MSLFIGAAHVMVAVNDAWRREYGEPALGVPVRETWTDPIWRKVQRVMDDVYRTNVAQSFPWAGGTAVIAPVEGPSGRGVVAVYERAVVPPMPLLPQRAPRSDRPVRVGA